METHWNKMEDNKSDPALKDKGLARWERFKLTYIGEINNLKEDGLLRAGKANRITEERLSDLETRFTQHDYDLEQINETQSVHDKAFQSIGKGGVWNWLGPLGPHPPWVLQQTPNTSRRLPTKPLKHAWRSIKDNNTNLNKAPSLNFSRPVAPRHQPAVQGPQYPHQPRLRRDGEAGTSGATRTEQTSATRAWTVITPGMGTKMKPPRLTPWEETPNAIICGENGVPLTITRCTTIPTDWLGGQ